MTLTKISCGSEGEEIKVSLACGQNKPDGFIGIDCVDIDGVDLVWNLNYYPWPIDDGSVDEIECSHYIEHIPFDWHDAINTATNDIYIDPGKTAPRKDGLIKFMDECYRILKPGGKMSVVSPYYSSVRAWQDPTHRRAISENTFFYFNKQWREMNKLDHYGIDSNFDFQWGYSWMGTWGQRHEEARVFATAQYINTVADIYVTLQKIA